VHRQIVTASRAAERHGFAAVEIDVERDPGFVPEDGTQRHDTLLVALFDTEQHAGMSIERAAFADEAVAVGAIQFVNQHDLAGFAQFFLAGIGNDHHAFFIEALHFRLSFAGHFIEMRITPNAQPGNDAGTNSGDNQGLLVFDIDTAEYSRAMTVHNLTAGGNVLGFVVDAAKDRGPGYFHLDV